MHYRRVSVMAGLGAGQHDLPRVHLATSAECTTSYYIIIVRLCFSPLKRSAVVNLSVRSGLGCRGQKGDCALTII